MMRRRARIDHNQPELVDFLRALGASVQHLHTVGEGVPDLLIGWRGRNLLAEVKDPEKPKSRQKLNEIESEWHTNWRGQVTIVSTKDDCLRLLDLL